MAKTQVLEFEIHLTDKDLVDTLNAEIDAGGGPTINPHAPSILVATGHRNGVLVAPYNPGPPEGGMAVTAADLDPNAIGTAVPVLTYGAPSESPALSSVWFHSSNNFPRDVATFTRKSGGWFGIPLLFGQTTKFYWSGRFVYTPLNDEVVDPGTGEVIDDPAPIPLAFFVDGNELPYTGEAGSGNTFLTSRDASGEAEGYGFAYRDNTGALKTHQFTEFGLTAPSETWHRIYINVRAYPGSEQGIIQGDGFPSSSDGWRLTMVPSGQLALYNRELGTNNLVGTTATAIPLNTRTKVDLLINWNGDPAPAVGGRLRLFVKGALIIDVNVTDGIGGQAASGNSEQLAALRQDPGGDNTFELDVDYWHCKEHPKKLGVESLTSIDWLNGSRTVLARPSALAPDFADWTGDFRLARQRPEEDDNDDLTSVTALAVCSFETDLPKLLTGIRQALGIGAFVVGMRGHRGTNSGELGYKLNAGADVYTNVTQVGGPNPGWNTILYRGANGTTPEQVTALHVKHRKGNDTTAGGVTTLMAVVELIGIFGDEDVPEGEEGPGLPPTRGVHNSAYPDSPWATMADAPAFGALHVVAGTYNGNGTGQDLAIKNLPCWVFIRRITGSADRPINWWTSLLSAHEDAEEGTRPSTIVDCILDPDFAGATAEDEQEIQGLVRIGPNALVNTNAQAYQYLAICDPAARFFLAGAFTHDNDGPLPATNPLVKPDFAPIAAFLWPENIGVTSTARLTFKGAGHSADAASNMGSGALANSVTLQAGAIVSRAGLHSTRFDQVAYLAMREDDGNVHDVPPFKVASWTGNGGASRTVGIDLGGRRPLFAILIPNNSNAIWRDPSHTSTNSSSWASGTHVTTGITGGGVDSVDVGSSGNANGVLYHLFVIPGGTTAGNNGWSQNGEFWPIEPDSETPDDWTEPTIIDNSEGEPEPTPPAEEPDLDVDTALPGTTLFCDDFTRKVCNMGLTRIGHSNLITDLVAESSREAVIAREHVKHEVETTLRDHPWSFATGYATLTLISGSETSPVNEDWTYLYAAPADYIEGRRVIDPTKDRKRQFTRDPEPWRMQSDPTNGRTIYANVADAEFEYTKRVTCPAFFGDRHFIDALAWRMAKVFAGPLARDTRLQDYCEKKYQEALAIAASHNRREAMRDRSLREHDASWIEEREGPIRRDRDKWES